MLSWTTKKAIETNEPQPIGDLMLQMIKDLEDTREIYHGYSYVRTMRNILIGKEDAAIAPYFKDKEYYGLYDFIQLESVEQIMDTLVDVRALEMIYTEHGKLYCTKEYHDFLCARRSKNV